LCCRRLADERRRADGELANRIAGEETTQIRDIVLPAVPAGLRQARQVCAPGMLIGILRNKLKAGD
jgi:hypothetical protein